MLQNKICRIVFCMIFSGGTHRAFAQELYKIPPNNPQTRWVSPENPTGGKGQAAKINKGAKGQAFYTIAPGEKKILFDVKTAGIIRRIWISGSIPITPDQRRMVRLDMYWDGAAKPAVSAPVGDFFGEGLGLISSYENDFFSSPEARSYNCTIPMPFKNAARIELTNESGSFVYLWYDIDFLQLQKQDDDILYFHTYWSRELATVLGKDFMIMPSVKGKGRYLGANIGVICDTTYQRTWFGEGEVKIYLDGDKNNPSLCGTGSEDYVGSGWGMGRFFGPEHGSLLDDSTHELFTFYRYHISDPVYFYHDCKVTIQQIGSMPVSTMKDMIRKNVRFQPVWYFKTFDNDSSAKPKKPEEVSLLDMQNSADINTDKIPDDAGVNYYRSDDVSATAYFYLNSPSSDLPALPSVDMRTKYLKTKVYPRAEPNYNQK
jgi:Protein of unknown function (DUF2961)